MSLEDGTYHDALIQGAQDVADGLDRLAERLGALLPICGAARIAASCDSPIPFQGSCL